MVAIAQLMKTKQKMCSKLLFKYVSLFHMFRCWKIACGIGRWKWVSRNFDAIHIWIEIKIAFAAATIQSTSMAMIGKSPLVKLALICLPNQKLLM